MKKILVIGLLMIGFVAYGQRDFGLKTEKVETYIFSNDTFSWGKNDKVIKWIVYAHPENTGNVYFKGVKATHDNFSTSYVPFDATVSFTGGLLIQVSDSIYAASRTTADSVIIIFYKKEY
jgi:hypothetical protein